MSYLLEKKTVNKVKNYLINFNKDIKLITLDESARTAMDAAIVLKKQVGAIVKSLLFKDNKDNEFYLCLISGDQYMSLEKLSYIVGSKIIKTNAAECKKFTGFSIGGVPPIAHSNVPKRIFIDLNLKKYEKLYAAAGHPYVVFGITFENLCNITNGEIVDIVK